MVSKKNQFTHKDSFDKQEARLFTASHYKSGRILSLSASNFVFEQLMAERTNNKIDAVEYEFGEYRRGLKEFTKVAKKYPTIKYEFDNIYNKQAARYGFIFLDLCQCINNQNIPQICSWLKTFKGTVCITLQRARETYMDRYMEINNATNLDNFRDDIFPKIIEQFTGLKQKCAHYDYRNRLYTDGTEKKHSTPMRIYTFTR